MVGKSYLRYVVGPQGGTVVSNEALTVEGALGRPNYAPLPVPRSGSFRGGRGGLGRGGAGRGSGAHNTPLQAMLFLPSLEAVRVYSIKSGVVLHTLIPAELKMPVEVTALHVVPLHQSSRHANSAATGGHGLGGGAGEVPVLREGWMLLVGYSNGYVAAFACTSTNNYGKPMCLFYALGHKIDTKVLTLVADPHPSTKTLLCSAGQDTDVAVWDLIGRETSFRLRGHRGGVTGMAFVPPATSTTPVRPAVAANNPNDQSAKPSPFSESSGRGEHSGVGVQVLVTAAADGWIKVWDLHLRQCLQTLVACDTQVTALYMDPAGSRLYCGMRENLIKVYNMEALSRIVGGGVVEEVAGGSSQMEALEHGIVPHGQVTRRHYKPITFMSATADGVFLLACTSNTIEVFRMNSSEEVKKKRQRKKKRKQKQQQEEEENEEEESTHPSQQRRTETGEGKVKKKDSLDNGGYAEAPAIEPSAIEEVTLLRTFFLTQKVRSACFLPPVHQSSSMMQEEEEELHIAVTYRNNDVQTYSTFVTATDLEGAVTYRLTDLKSKYSLSSQGHQSDVRRLCFVDNDTALLSLSREKLMLWTVSIRHDLLSEEEGLFNGGHAASHDYYDEKEANVKRVEAQGSLAAVGQIALEEATAMDAIHSALCCVGQADGALRLVDVAASLVLFTEPNAHMGGVKHVTRTPQLTGFLSIGEDRRLLSWTLGVTNEERGGDFDVSQVAFEENSSDEEEANAGKSNPRAKQSPNTKKRTERPLPTLLLAHEVELTELPLFVECSLDNRYVGVGLQNHHIQLFFADSMKPYLSLFGHKLPPTSMSFSSDGALVASVGMDKSLRFWGTDFGDCHRAIHAHDDYVTEVQFLHDTHYVFTVSMDGSVKQWDGDHFTMIQLFRQHQRGLWAVAATLNGTCVVAAGADKCLRTFLRTDGIVFPEEEELRMAHEAMEEEASKAAARARLDGHDGSEVGVAGHSTPHTAEAAERLMAALDLISVERQRQQNPEDVSPRHPLLANKTESEYLWGVMQSIRPSDIRHALNGLTSLHVDAVLNALLHMMEEGAVLNYEIATKFLLGLVMPAPGMGTATGGHRFIAVAGDASGTSTEPMRGLQRLERLRRGVAAGLDQTVTRLDYNTAGLQAVRHALEETERIRFFDLSKIQGHKKKYHSQAL